MSLERLAVLAAGTTNYGVAGRGGKPEWSGVELAGALAPLTDVARNLALLKYAGDNSCRPAIFYVAMVRVAWLFTDRGWKNPRGEQMIRKLTSCALFELIDQPVCPDCSGTGIDESYRECQDCGGIGRVRFSGIVLAHALGRGHSQYHEIWKPRYQMIIHDLSRWLSLLECHAADVLQSQMRSGS